MKNIVLAFLILSFTGLSGQNTLKAEHIDSAGLPKQVKYEGSFKDAIRWSDSLGRHIVLLTETGIHRNKKFSHENDGVDAELFAYHFLLKGDSVTRLWKVYDYISDCPVDIEASFIKSSFQVTDLDKDGVAEVWLMYKTVCHGDVSPCNMKIIMYEGVQKFAMRGRNKVFEGKDEKGIEHYEGGEYTFDEAFTGGPELFRVFAKALWKKNIMQTWDE